MTAERLHKLAEVALTQLESEGGSYVQVFAEATFREESASYFAGGKGYGFGLQLGIGVQSEAPDGSIRYRAMAATRIAEKFGKALKLSVEEELLSRQNIGQKVLEHDCATIRNLYFDRNAVVADSTGLVAYSRSSGRRIELDLFDAQHVLMRRWYSEDGQFDIPDLIRDAASALWLYRNAQILGEVESPVVFHGATSALLLHELLGHPLEYDNYQTARHWLDAVDARALPRDLVFLDSPAVVGGYGSYSYDDAGNEAREHHFLLGGQFHPLCDSSGSHKMRGGIRRQDYRFPGIPRGSNAIVLPGSTPSDALLDYHGSGLLHIYSLGAGRIDIASGEYIYSAPEALWVDSNGAEHRLLDVYLHGRVSDMLASIEAVGDDYGTANITCGKQGQYIPLGAQGASIRVGSMNWRS